MSPRKRPAADPVEVARIVSEFEQARALDRRIERDRANRSLPADDLRRAQRAHEKWDAATAALVSVLEKGDSVPFSGGVLVLAEKLKKLQKELADAAHYLPLPKSAARRPEATRAIFERLLMAAGLSRPEARRRVGLKP